MTLELTEKQHILLDRYLDTVLENYKSGAWTLMDARLHLAQAFTLAANDQSSVVNYMQTATNGDEDA
ncbi:hypothetical protein [Acidocella aromatica]|uniref:Uncharacterized protein n=1 Tax=Acidocella aromatica TaxID=1303579 RepID=A0A840VEZ2_9PROT|nr:hypothetical protein [Acidocella aromatica]MBB5373457.1 hypothetical protein [Acidocella aromatica]